jgi:hypothetical protein
MMCSHAARFGGNDDVIIANIPLVTELAVHAPRIFRSLT